MMTGYRHSDTSLALGKQPQYNRGDSNRAREAAEALFAPKQQVVEPAAPTAHQTARKPRVLSAVPMQPPRTEPAKAPDEHMPLEPAPQIPGSHLNRIRTWLKYGMTIRQVAVIYGVATRDIEGMLQKD